MTSTPTYIRSSLTAGSFARGTALSNDSGVTETAGITRHLHHQVPTSSTSVKRSSPYQHHLVPATTPLLKVLDFRLDASPYAGQKVTSGGLGDTYVYNASLLRCGLRYAPTENDLVTDGTNVFKVQAGGDWYTQQEAFAGLPWYRFAGRPGTSANALERGASNDELNIIVYDATGNYTGSKGNVETYFGVSKLAGATTHPKVTTTTTSK